MISCELSTVLGNRSRPFKVRCLKLFEFVLPVLKLFGIYLFVSNCFAILERYEYIISSGLISFVFLRDYNYSPGRVVQFVGVCPHTPKRCRFDSSSGHIHRLQIRFLVGKPIDVFLSPSLCKSINIFLGEELEKCEYMNI